MDKPTLRAMTHDDLEAVLVLERAGHSQPWSPGHFRDSLAAGHFMPTLWQGEALCGYLVAMPGVEEAHLLTLTVDARCRGQGLGQTLMQAMHHWAQAQGAQQLWLEVRQSNLAAQALYARMGYEEVALRKNYYRLPEGGHEHALIMRKTLVENSNHQSM